MANVKFTTNEAFKEVFGIYSQVPLFVPPRHKAGGGTPAFEAEIMELNELASDDRVSDSGVIVPDRLRFTYEQKMYKLPIESVAEYSRAKVIEKTTMQGQDGTVKEYIGLDDWQITVRGFIINNTNQDYPLEAVEEMRRFFETKVTLGCQSEWMSSLGIFYAVCTDLRLPPMAGYSNKMTR